MEISEDGPQFLPRLIHPAGRNDVSRLVGIEGALHRYGLIGSTETIGVICKTGKVPPRKSPINRLRFLKARRRCLLRSRFQKRISSLTEAIFFVQIEEDW